MRWLGKVAMGLVAALAVLIAVVVVRAMTFEAPAAVAPTDLKLAPPERVDVARAAGNLAAAVRIRTVSHQDPAEDQPAEWDRLHAWLQATYPAAHAAMTRETVAGHGLVYTWAGADPARPPIILMAHQDVVPVTPGTEKDWRHPPFDGVIAEGAVWGRGSVDDKGSLVGLMEAAEGLATRGFRPARTVIFVFGHDEEVRGQGAEAAAALLKSRGVMADFVLDEGLLVTTDNPIAGGPLAIIGVAEKGYATLAVTAKAQGGHSSAPPKDTGVVTLSRAVVAIAENGAPLRFDGPGAEMVRSAAGEAPFAMKAVVANSWLFEPLLVRQIGATPQGAALLHTTIAPTMLKGSPKENVLPQDATAWINFRLAPGDPSAEVMARAKAAVGDLPVSLAWSQPPKEATPVSSTNSAAWKMMAALARDVTGAPVAPGLVVAGTDSRSLQPVARDVYRFQPIEMTLAETAMIHGTNERMTLKNLERMIQFYARLIATSAG